MSFLDNSGDIILDAVLTDAGRARLAKADGSFQITKFALADDEINYGLYNKSHPSGSAYYDLDIMQTPVFEAFTNNTSTVKFKLQSISRTNILYLPVLKLNVDNSTDGSPDYTAGGSSYNYLVACDDPTYTAVQNDGVINGIAASSNEIVIDQGLDTTEIARTFAIDSDLKETQYLIEIDNRFGSIVSKDNTTANLSFIDDDNIASYYLSTADSSFVKNIPIPTTTSANSSVNGPVGTRLRFAIKASLDLNSSTFLFTQLGNVVSSTSLTGGGTGNYYVISTNIKVTGVTTGYSLNIPVRFVKLQ